MANNNAIYNAVITGAGGATQERWLTSANPAVYAAFKTAVEAIATEVDSEIPAGSISASQQSLMQSICQGVFAGRYPTADSYVAIAGAIVALYTSLTASLLPDATPGGGIAPLSNVFYVDGGNVQASPDGSIGNPFPTVQEALTACQGLAVQFAGVLIAPGDYSAEALTYSGNTSLQLSAATGTSRVYSNQSNTIIGNLVNTGFGQLYLNGLKHGSINGGFASINLEDCDCNGVTVTCDGGIVGAFNCAIESTLLEGANIRVRSSELRAPTIHATGATVEVTDTLWIVSGAVNFDSDFPSFLRLDSMTLYNWQQMGGSATISNGTVLPLLPV